MSDLKDDLNTRFNIATQSSSEHEFYLNVYQYFDFIYKTPELKDIWDENEKEYRKKHIAIWKKRPMTDEEAEEADAQTIKLERFSLYAVGSFMEGRIYLPIDDYKKTNEPDTEQDPVAVILVRGAKYAATLARPTTIGKWNKDALKSYSRWFEGKRGFYESQLRRLHAMLLDEISKLKPQVEIKRSVDRKGIYYNSEAGIGWAKGKDFKFKLGKPITFLFALLYERAGKSVAKEEIWKIIGRSGNTLAINEIAKEIREKVGLSTKEMVLSDSNLILTLEKLESSPD